MKLKPTNIITYLLQRGVRTEAAWNGAQREVWHKEEETLQMGYDTMLMPEAFWYGEMGLSGTVLVVAREQL